MAWPDVTPKTESGRALLAEQRGIGSRSMREEPLNTILAIEQEAASKAVAEVLDEPVPLNVERLARALEFIDTRRTTTVNAKIVAAEYARLTDPKGATDVTPKTEPRVCSDCGRVIGPLDWPRQPADVTPETEPDEWDAHGPEDRLPVNGSQYTPPET